MEYMKPSILDDAFLLFFTSINDDVRDSTRYSAAADDVD